jgi:CLIP-associating protein 1/2
MSTLDSNSKRLLEKDPGNPNSPSKPQLKTQTSMRAPALSRDTTNLTGPRISLKETIAARKKAAAAGKELPPRPGSAQSSFTPMKPPGAAPGLSSAPVRPLRPSRKAETARPVTADPYARRNAKVESPVTSPDKGNDEELTLVIPATKPTIGAKTPQKAAQPTKPVLNSKTPSKTTAPMKLAADNTSASSDAEELEILKVYEDPASASDDAGTAPGTLITTEETAETCVLTRPNPGPTAQASPLVVLTPGAAPAPTSASVPKITFTPKSVPALQVEEPEHSYRDDWRKVVATETPKILPEAEIPKGEVKARRLLDSGIAKIRSRTLDPHGFRMLQGLARNHPIRQALQENNGEEILYDIWDDGKKFSELLHSLLDYLETPIVSLLTCFLCRFSLKFDIRMTSRHK